MAKKVNDYVREIKKALKDHKVYSAALDIQILSLASALRNLELANDELDRLEGCSTKEITRYGEREVQHPALKTSREAQRSITEQMKALNLTVADLSGEADDDPLADLTKKLTKKRKQAVTIKPKSDD